MKDEGQQKNVLNSLIHSFFDCYLWGELWKASNKTMVRTILECNKNGKWHNYLFMYHRFRGEFGKALNKVYPLGNLNLYSTNCTILWKGVNSLISKELSRRLQRIFTRKMVDLDLQKLNKLKFLWIYYLFCFVYMKNVFFTMK